MNSQLNEDLVIDQCRCWVEHFVIEHNLCPFARKPAQAGQVRYVVSQVDEPEALLADFINEIEILRATSASEIETTVLIHPHVLNDFLDYNDFLDVIDSFLQQAGYADEFQVASLHPGYQFAETDIDDVENYTNRSPYPILHLLREASVSKVLQGYTDPDEIPARNIRKMKQLGAEQVREIFAACNNVEAGKD